MEQDIPWTTLEKVFSKQATVSEQTKIAQWLTRAAENKIIFTQLQNYFNENGALPLLFIPDVKAAYLHINEKLHSQPSKPNVHILSRTLWWRVAAVFLIIMLCWWMVQKQHLVRNFTYASTITTDSMQTSLVLADGTRVWLNYGSKLQFPKHFNKKREVFLSGECYFEVARDTLHPFIVNAGKAQIKVLGTKFNVKAYQNFDNDNVTVSEGKVSYGVDNQKVLLMAGDFGVYSRQSGAVTRHANSNPNYLSWKTKIFYFNEKPLSVVFSELSEVYRFTYRFSDPTLSALKLTGQFLNQPVPEIITAISKTFDIAINNKNGVYIIGKE
jgi:ferric-dicitrate binding protein FerR (iron transport regulator)